MSDFNNVSLHDGSNQKHSTCEFPLLGLPLGFPAVQQPTQPQERTEPPIRNGNGHRPLARLVGYTNMRLGGNERRNEATNAQPNNTLVPTEPAAPGTQERAGNEPSQLMSRLSHVIGGLRSAAQNLNNAHVNRDLLPAHNNLFGEIGVQDAEARPLAPEQQQRPQEEEDQTQQRRNGRREQINASVAALRRTITTFNQHLDNLHVPTGPNGRTHTSDFLPGAQRLRHLYDDRGPLQHSETAHMLDYLHRMAFDMERQLSKQKVPMGNVRGQMTDGVWRKDPLTENAQCRVGMELLNDFQEQDELLDKAEAMTSVQNAIDILMDLARTAKPFSSSLPFADTAIVKTCEALSSLAEAVNPSSAVAPIPQGTAPDDYRVSTVMYRNNIYSDIMRKLWEEQKRMLETLTRELTPQQEVLNRGTQEAWMEFDTPMMTDENRPKYKPPLQAKRSATERGREEDMEEMEEDDDSGPSTSTGFRPKRSRYN